jgi:hypothetical protein
MPPSGMGSRLMSGARPGLLPAFSLRSLGIPAPDSRLTGKSAIDNSSGYNDSKEPPTGDRAVRSVRELVPTEELDRVLHAYHPEVATTARNAIVNGVAE